MSQQYYKLTIEEAISHYNQGDLTAKGLVHFYLKVKIKPGWTIHKSAKEICEELGIKKSAFYNAMSRLKADGAIDWSVPENTSFSISLPFRECGNNSATAESDSTSTETNSAVAESDSTSTETNSATAESDSTSTENESPKASNSEAFKHSPDSSQIYSQIHTQIYPHTFLSEATEREKNVSFFNSLNFSEKKKLLKAANIIANNLPQRPTLIDKWAMYNSIEIFNSHTYSALSKNSDNSSTEEKPQTDQPSLEEINEGLRSPDKANWAMRCILNPSWKVEIIAGVARRKP